MFTLEQSLVTGPWIMQVFYLHLRDCCATLLISVGFADCHTIGGCLSVNKAQWGYIHKAIPQRGTLCDIQRTAFPPAITLSARAAAHGCCGIGGAIQSESTLIVQLVTYVQISLKCKQGLSIHTETAPTCGHNANEFEVFTLLQQPCCTKLCTVCKILHAR